VKYVSSPSQPRHRRYAAAAHRVQSRLRSAAVSRRHFLQGAAGLTAFAATLGHPRAALARGGPGIGLVLPIPTTIDIFGQPFHVQAPPFTGADSDPSSVYNFEGAVGIAFISGSVQRIDRKTGEARTMPFAFNDMRFMQGRFRGRDGHERDATFIFT
jgi:hypothetical protein